MRLPKRFSKLVYSALGVGVVLTSSALASAADCVTDKDCPGTDCGGQVCQWVSTTSHVCMDAGSKSHGSDGWCNTVADCKCQSVGAKCNAQFSCSFVLPADAPPAGGAGGMSGAGGANGASGGAGGVGGSLVSGGGTAGTPASGGDASSGQSGSATVTAGTSNTSTAGTANDTPEGPITGSPSAPDAGGCTLATHTQSHSLFALGLLSAALLFARRRTAS